jgi:diguanylate cyclase (GGDEF)-like protein
MEPAVVPAEPPSDASPFEPAYLAEAFRAAIEAAAREEAPTAALDAAVQVLHERLQGSFVAALVREHERLWLVASSGYAVIPDGIPVDTGVVGRAVRSGRCQYVPDLAADPDFIPVVEGITSELAIPFIVAGTVEGVINIETPRTLPRQSARLAAPLAKALAPVVAAVRGGRVLDLPALSRLFVYVSSLRNPRQIAEVTAASLMRVLPVETSQVFLVGDGRELELLAERRAGPGVPDPPSVETAKALRERVERGAVFEQVELEHPGDDELSAITALVVIPLRANGDEIGLLVGGGRTPHVFGRQQAEVASVLAAQAAASLDAALALGRERKSALTDPLTGLLNRRGFELELDAALAAAHDQRNPLSLWVLDFDDFKEVNDRAGHEFGDALLREVAHVLTGVLPSGACAGRMGGDEFVVMQPGAAAESAAELAQSLRERLLGGLDEAGFPLRVSIGVSTYPFDGGSGSELLRAADQAVYEAKARGKNRLVGFRELVRDATTGASLAPGAQNRRSGGIEAATLIEASEAAGSIWRERALQNVLDRLCKTLTFVVGATGCNVSRIVGPRLVDVAAHALRDVGLAADTSYLIDEFPVTKAVLETLEPQSISFLDGDLDRAEAFVLRELEMSCALLLPIVVSGAAWGLVELYDMRLRRYSREQAALAAFLVGVASQRLEALGDDQLSFRRLPI